MSRGVAYVIVIGAKNWFVENRLPSFCAHSCTSARILSVKLSVGALILCRQSSANSFFVPKFFEIFHDCRGKCVAATICDADALFFRSVHVFPIRKNEVMESNDSCFLPMWKLDHTNETVISKDGMKRETTS